MTAGLVGALVLAAPSAHGVQGTPGSQGAQAGRSAPGATALLKQLADQAAELEGELEAQRAGVLSASTAHDQLLATSRRGVAVRKQLSTLAARGDTAAPVARLLGGDQGVLALTIAQVEREAQRSRGRVEEVTDTAAATQGDLLDTRRRADAFAAALEGARRNPGQLTSDVTYGFGGEGTAPVSAESIDEFLESKASPIAGSGKFFVASGVRWRVDPRFVVAIAGAESYFGLQICAPHNAWGWGCPNNPFAFDSWAAGIETVTKGLRENYLDEGRNTVGQIHLKYAPPAAANDPTGLNYAWPDNVAKFLTEQRGNPQKLDGSGPGGKPRTGVE